MKLVIVSNRLPITVEEKSGNIEYRESVGGLVTALTTYLNWLGKTSSNKITKHIWFGWLGSTISEKMKGPVKEKLFREYKCYPVFISEKEIDKFYNGFCNKTIWPLFHYFPSLTVYDDAYWLTYKRINDLFCNTVLEIIQPNDLIWIHDYHLMLLPKLLKEKVKNPIGFFLHIPFPNFELFRLLPSMWRIEILEGILGADLIGFHTHDYTQYFLRCVLRILGYEHNMGEIIINRIINVDTFPISIDFERFYNSQKRRDVKKEKKELLKSLSGYKVILSVDRLDYTKGIINRLYAYEDFLKKNSQWHRKVVFVLIVVPSRVGMEQYKQMEKQVDEAVGKINGRYGDIHWAPILYQFKYLPFNQLAALYSISHVCLVTPLRDGMNLVAKEYIATRTDKTGVLILSEMAGAAKELNEAIIINPNNVKEISDAIKFALELPKDEQIKRNEIIQKRLKNYSVVQWANNFIERLLLVVEKQKAFNAKLLTDDAKQQLLDDYFKAKTRLLFLDYDGTLAPFVGDPQLVKPDEKLITLLKSLSEENGNKVVLISGRDKETLQRWFGKVGIGLVAEHGAYIKENEDWKMIKPLRNNWKQQILPILEMYVERLPGSVIEEKEYAVVWHYRKTDPETGPLLAKELLDYLVSYTTNMDIQILKGDKVVEITNSGVNKGSATIFWTSKNDYDFILAIGDDLTDEEMFKVLPEKAYSIKVGMGHTNAKYNVRSYVDIIQLLKELVSDKENLWSTYTNS